MKFNSNLIAFPPIYKPVGSTLRNLFGYHVPSDLLILEDAQSIQIKKNILVHWQHAALS